MESQAKSVFGLVVSLALLALTACGGSAPARNPAKPSSTQTASSAASSSSSQRASSGLKTVHLTLDFLPAGYQAPFVVALKKGFYKQAGLDVHIQPGKGSPITAQQVASGTATFGFADFGAVVRLIAKGAPIKAVMVLVQDTPLCVISKASLGITTPAKIKGHTWAMIPGGSASYMVPAFLNATGVPRSDVKLYDVSPSAKLTAFETGKSDVILGFLNVEIPELKAKGFKLNELCYPKYGINMLEDAVFTQNSIIQHHPAMVKAFVAATSKGYQYAAAHTDEAISDVQSQFPNSRLNASVAKEELMATLRLAHTPATEGKPLGWTAETDVAHTLQLLSKYAGLKTEKSPSAFYTNAFIPGES